MRVLHLFSNWKWTGPSELAVNLCRALRDEGVDVRFACSKGPGPNEPITVADKARQAGLEPVTSFHLEKHRNPVINAWDIGKLRKFLREQQIRIVHTHLPNDHLIGGTAARKTDPQITVVRTSYFGDGFKRTILNRRLLSKHTDVLLESSRAALEHDRKLVDPAGLLSTVVDPALDTGRFSPDRAFPDMRRKYGLAENDFVVGIVARMQPYRRFDVFLQAVALARKSVPNLKVLMVGRGTKKEEVAVRPTRKMGLSDCVVFTGYLQADDYVGILAAMDVKVFLVPGTDGTCRALREAMAMGKPAVVARRGMLPEIVDHEVNGFVVEDTAANLAGAIRQLAHDRQKTAEMGRNALKKVLQRHTLKRQAEAVRAIYEQVAGLRP
jgi:glycosyltransferase involved in cell wall biosynthesis